MIPWGRITRSVLAAALLLGSACEPEREGSDPMRDPDGGIARAYFQGIRISPASFVRTHRTGGNILWIVIDALRPDHMGAYGYDHPTTPFLDDLATRSLVFLNAYANAPWTRPSVATMLTGLHPSGHRTQTDRSTLPPGIRTLGQELGALGFRTAAVVANGNAGSIAGLDRGFDHYVDTATHWEGRPTAAQVYREAEIWLKRQAGPQPWFLFVFLLDPHDPYRAPPRYEREWLDEAGAEPRRSAHWEHDNAYPASERRSMIALYDASIRYVDDQTRAFFSEMESLGAIENTTVVVTADHGEGFGEHGYYLHSHHHYDEILRVPLLISSPSWEGHGHVFHLVQLADLHPTLVSIAGGAVPGGVSGEDLGGLLTRRVDTKRTLFSEYNEFGIRRSSAFNLEHRVILQLPADREAFLERIPDPDLLPSVRFDEPVLEIFDRVADPLDREVLPADRVPPGAGKLADRLRAYMEATPPSHTAAREIPRGVRRNLEALGYVGTGEER